MRGTALPIERDYRLDGLIRVCERGIGLLDPVHAGHQIVEEVELCVVEPRHGRLEVLSSGVDYPQQGFVSGDQSRVEGSSVHLERP